MVNLRKHPFLRALRRWGRFEKSEEKRMFSQATKWLILRQNETRHICLGLPSLPY